MRRRGKGELHVFRGGVRNEGSQRFTTRGKADPRNKR